MKKSIIALTLIVVATVSMMTSCTKDEKPLTLSDLAGYTFQGKQVNADKSEIKYTLVFDKSDQKFTFDSTQPFHSEGTYKISGISVILNYSSGAVETLKSETQEIDLPSKKPRRYSHKKVISVSNNKKEVSRILKHLFFVCNVAGAGIIL